MAGRIAGLSFELVGLVGELIRQGEQTGRDGAGPYNLLCMVSAIVIMASARVSIE